MRAWRYVTATLVLTGVLVFGGVAPALAETTDGEDAVVETFNYQALVVDLLEKANDALQESARSNMNSYADTADFVMGLLDGVEEGTGVIAYLEALTGKSAADLDDQTVTEIIRIGAESPELVALAHVLVARQALTRDDMDAQALAEAYRHLSEARALMRGEFAE